MNNAYDLAVTITFTVATILFIRVMNKDINDSMKRLQDHEEAKNLRKNQHSEPIEHEHA